VLIDMAVVAYANALPLVERAHRTARESIEAIGRMRQVPSMRVERAEAVNIVLLAPGSSG
jgi:hypothetical protein